MKKITGIVCAVLLASNVFSYDLRGIEVIPENDLSQYFTVPSEEDGPGIDFFYSQRMVLNIKNAVLPVTLANDDKDSLMAVLKETGRTDVDPAEYTYKIVFTFKSKATWHTDDATLVCFVSSKLNETMRRYIGAGQEYHLIITVPSFNTVDMSGAAIVNDFLTVVEYASARK